MRSSYSYLLAGAVAMAGFGVGTYGETKVKDIVDPAKNSGDKLEQLGSQMADETTAQEVRGLLAKAVNEAVTEGKFGGLVGYLAKKDRDRMGDFKTAKTEGLNRVIAEFRADFKAKYNQEFDIKPEHFRDAIVYAGRDKNSATVSVPELQLDRKPDSGTAIRPLVEKTTEKGSKPLVVKAGENVVREGTAAAVPKIAVAGQKGDLKGELAENVSTGLTLNMINEGRLVSAWRIDVPNEITAEQLKGNLLKHLQMFDDQKAMWPMEASAAYHAASYHVLEALIDASLVSER